MFVSPAPSCKRFCARLSHRVGLSRPMQRLLVMFVMGIVLLRGRRSLAALGDAVATCRRYRGQVSRATRNRAFRTRDLYLSAFSAELAASAPPEAERVTWVLALDDVSTKRGAFTKIENGLRKGHAVEAPGKKEFRPPSKCHTFLLSLLITHEGKRLPLPRRTWRTKDYAKTIGKPYVTKIQLAIVALEDLKRALPRNVDLVVVADEFYEGKEMLKACKRLGFTLVVPVDSRRVFNTPVTRSNKKREPIHKYGRSLPTTAFERLVLERGKEETASYRRYTPDEQRRNEPRTFRVAHESREVAGLGNVGVVYSWKSPVYRPRRCRDRETFKVLVCSDPSLPAKRVAELYDLRWQVEIFYRELKSGLGLGSYTGTSFEAFERLVDLTLLSFLYLEQHRERLLGTSAGTRQRLLAGARTAEIRHEVEREAARTDVDWFQRRLKSNRGRTKLRSVLRHLRLTA